MNFSRILDGAEVLSQSGSCSVKGLDYDSRRVQPSWLFVAMRGESTDGNRYIDAAIAAGAVAVVTDSAEQTPRKGVAWAVVPHGRRALARLSANFYKRPAERLCFTGITGTNGKTTASFIVEAILRAAKRKSALIGTVEYHLPGEVLVAPHTTPESLELNQMFARCVAHGATEVVMEVSSHALKQARVFGIPFDVAVFSNLTQDHLDYHKTMEDYFAAKRVLFEGCGTEPPRCAIVNVDDEYGRSLAEFSRRRSKLFTFGIKQGDFHAERLEMTPLGNKFTLATPGEPIELTSPLIGLVNVYNVIAACAAAYARGCTPEQIVRGIDGMRRVPGRFERVDEAQPFAVVVDYAHTDDALKNLTRLARDFASRSNGRVITVFGCGGDRDRTKRPKMGRVAGEGSDFVVITSDNPRSEDPRAIIEDAVPGLRETRTPFIAEPDRRNAIAIALSEARAGDIVLLAGKGHERVQITREGELPFDDHRVASEELNRIGYKRGGRA
ncbi:MAG: UDP-N-acetylmuramoyl-L-alanyl-D-glutamate--2,6-diaminopimelate ligase [Acidobacteria bacterium]|nr:MAG: UDP-N-acetylmuramoyl-L-alanyl-D-glutamate--2,6-diaminopimelate ligase [Acidobacteriota bacterium]